MQNAILIIKGGVHAKQKKTQTKKTARTKLAR
jgi:hypothetical protein